MPAPQVEVPRMSFRDFALADAESKLGLTLTTERLFADIREVTPRPDFLETLTEGVLLAQGIDNEKARSEFVIAPTILEFRRMRGNRNAIYSGVEFNVDASKGLNGYCDFLITRSPRLYLVTAPVIAVAEGKNDNVNSGLGQCIAEMRAAWLFNATKGEQVTQVFGAATTGTHWKFLRLRDTQVSLDTDEYFIHDIGKILAILLHMADAA
jgi:hypothetical protein